MNVDTTVELCGIELKNPTMLASGILGGNAGILRRVAENGAGALVTKSIGSKARPGYPGPTVIEPMENVLLNAMGLPNPGYKEFVKELDELKDLDTPVIPSIFGENYEDFAVVAKAMEKAGSKLIEINVSCPHIHARDRKKRLIGQDSEETAKVVKTIKKAVKIPIMVKLSPNVTDIGEIAVEAVMSGADAISAINTIEAFDIEPVLERPILGNLLGGQSGAAIKPIALRKVANIVKSLRDAEEAGKINKSVPVVGIGGIESGADIVRFLLVGAQCIQIGTGCKRDIAIFNTCVKELKEHMKRMNYEKLDDFRGNALEWLH